MRIVMNEIKKIFTPKMLILLLLINIIMYFLFIEFNVRYFPNGRPEGDDYRISVQMQKDYGTNMDENEFQNFKSIYNKELNEADKYVQNHKEFSALGIKNYKEYLDKTDEYLNKNSSFGNKVSKLKDNIMFEKGINLFWEIPEREMMITDYQNRSKILLSNYDITTKNQKIRIDEITNNKDDITSVFNDFIFNNYNNFIFSVAITILLSIVFMLSTIYIRDTNNNMLQLQYTSKKGRQIFKSKMMAGFISSFIIATSQFICFFTMYAHNNVAMFFNSNINSFLCINISWFDLTFIQYIVITVLAVYILAMVFTLMSMLISSLVHNYIALIGIQLPMVLFIFKRY